MSDAEYQIGFRRGFDRGQAEQRQTSEVEIERLTRELDELRTENAALDSRVERMSKASWKGRRGMKPKEREAAFRKDLDELMILSHCPWCGAEAVHVNPSGGRSGYANWACGSSKTGNEPWQSTSCELRVATAEIERLTREMDEREKAAWWLYDKLWSRADPKKIDGAALQQWPWLVR